MSIEIIDPTQVFEDGVLLGKVADTIANMPNLAALIQLELERWWLEQGTVQAQEIEQRVNQFKADYEQRIEQLQQQVLERQGIETELAIATNRIQTLEAENAMLQAQLNEVLNSPVADNGLTPEEIAQFRELLQRLS